MPDEAKPVETQGRIEAQVIRKQHLDTSHDALGVLLCQSVAAVKHWNLANLVERSRDGYTSYTAGRFRWMTGFDGP